MYSPFKNKFRKLSCLINSLNMMHKILNCKHTLYKYPRYSWLCLEDFCTRKLWCFIHAGSGYKIYSKIRAYLDIFLNKCLLLSKILLTHQNKALIRLLHFIVNYKINGACKLNKGLTFDLNKHFTSNDLKI